MFRVQASHHGRGDYDGRRELPRALLHMPDLQAADRGACICKDKPRHLLHGETPVGRKSLEADSFPISLVTTSGWLAVGDTLKQNGNEQRERTRTRIGIRSGVSFASQEFLRCRTALQSLLHLSSLRATISRLLSSHRPQRRIPCTPSGSWTETLPHDPVLQMMRVRGCVSLAPIGCSLGPRHQSSGRHKTLHCLR